MSKKQTDRSHARPLLPKAPPTPLSDADRLARGLALESGDAQPRPARRLH